MSRTNRKYRDISEDFNPIKISIGSDSRASYFNRGAFFPKKLKPYSAKPPFWKDKVSKSEHVPGWAKGISKYDKLITKNANRAIKKSKRQQLKIELKNELENT